MSIFEVVMLLCFGAAWPFSIYKSFKSRSTKGKSIIFLVVLIAGYGAGILNKLFYNMDPVIYLYIINLLMVGTDSLLWIRNRKIEQRIKG